MKSSLILSLILLGACSGRITEKGIHRGHITDVSVQGMFCKTMEGQVMTGSGNSSVKYNFTIENETAFEALTKALENNDEVSLKYESRFYWFNCDGGPNFVSEVKVLKKGDKK